MGADVPSVSARSGPSDAGAAAKNELWLRGRTFLRVRGSNSGGSPSVRRARRVHVGRDDVLSAHGPARNIEGAYVR